MSLTPGARLGPYEIVSRLGAGGMGEVYRAKDIRLDRIVALKVLPPDRIGDADARSRFEREAKAIAALSHPNICAIHDVGLADPATPPYLVMELLEGQTLQERLLRGPLDVEQVVDFGTALADALETAHLRGLIHRDLKPANIFITSRGIPKILDFGLAKALDPGSKDPGLHSAEADVTRRRDDALTEMGTTVGTVAYMSPEQLRGDILDVRSDLFSFGIVLYEMATGQRAFSGQTSAVVSAAILTQEPLAPTAARPELPPRLEETILKALEKDRNVRCQSAAELRADLTRLRRQSGSQTTRVVAASMPTSTITTLSGSQTMAGAPAPFVTPSSPGVATTPAPPSTNRGIWIGVAVLAGVLILGGGYWIGTRGGVAERGNPPPPVSPSAPPSIPPQAGPPPLSEVRSATAPKPAPRTEVTPTPAPPPATPTPPAVTPAPTSVTPPLVGNAARGGKDANQPGARAGRGLGRRGIGPGLPPLVSLLRTLPPLPFDLAYSTGDERARELATQLRGALTAGGWTSTSMAEVPGQHLPMAVFVPQPSPSATALINWARASGFNPEVRAAPRLPRLRIVIGR